MAVSFDLFDPTKKSAAIRAVKQAFNKAGCPIVSIDVDDRVQRKAGQNYRDVTLSFGDSQTVRLSVKSTGDIFKVTINKTELPINAQDDQGAAVAEIVGAMERGRKKFQAAMAKVKFELPPAIRTAAPRMEAVLAQRIADLDAGIEDARAELSMLNAAPGN